MLKVLLAVIVFAAVTYALIRVIERRGVSTPASRLAERVRRAAPRAQRPVGPDDDEDFLRDLDRRRRHGGDADPSA